MSAQPLNCQSAATGGWWRQPDKDAVTGSQRGAVWADDFLGQANEYGQAEGDHARPDVPGAIVGVRVRIQGWLVSVRYLAPGVYVIFVVGLDVRISQCDLVRAGRVGLVPSFRSRGGIVMAASGGSRRCWVKPVVEDVRDRVLKCVFEFGMH